MSTKTVRTICFECHSRCGVLVEVVDGKIVGIKGDKDHPISHGYMCPKGIGMTRPSSKQLARTWPFKRYSAYQRELRDIAEKWFSKYF